MVDQSRRDRVGLGLIGLGSCWEPLYRDTLFELKNRLTVRLVYDPVEARAKSVADEFDAELAASLSHVLARQTLQGLLVIDPGWLGAGAFRMIARSGKPVYLASPALRQVEFLRMIGQDNGERHGTQHSDDLWIPEFRFRFTPCTCRLRELIATKLGSAEQIQIDCDLTADNAELAHLVDWCSHLMGKPPISSVVVGMTPARGLHIDLTFGTLSKPCTATLQHSAEPAGPIRFSITCERGTAELTDRTKICWRTANESAQEVLTDERSETEILFDQFCRRAVGGINPVGRLSEFLKAIEIVESIKTRV